MAATVTDDLVCAAATAQLPSLRDINTRVYYCAKLRILCYVHMMICVAGLLYTLSCVADIV